MDETLKAVKRLKNGDIGGLETLVARYQQHAMKTAFLILQDEASAQDIVQETFIRIYQKIYLFDEKQAFEPYLLKSVVNASLNFARRAKEISLDGDTTEIELLLNDNHSPETITESRQLGQQILSALEKLSPNQRTAIIQRYYLGMSEREMAESLQTPPGTIKWLLNAARTRLRELLRPERSNT